MDERTVVAVSRLMPREGQRDALLAGSRQLVGSVRGTPGCLGAQVFISADDPGAVVVVSLWAGAEELGRVEEHGSIWTAIQHLILQRPQTERLVPP